MENEHDVKLFEIEDDMDWIIQEVRRLNKRIEFLIGRYRELQMEQNVLIIKTNS